MKLALIRYTAAALCFLAFAAAMPALAQDPFVYRDCMAQCRQFKDRSCCHETCSYNACIADKTKASIGQTDPGAWSAAMAACYSWISVLQQCSAGTPGAPPLGAAASSVPVDIAGTWKFHPDWVYVIAQRGETFTWSMAKFKETAEGKLTGTSVSAKWKGTNGPGSATGRLTVDANGRATRIDWSNGVVFVRR